MALVGYFIHVVVPRLSGRRNPGCLAVGYLLDLIDIVKPDMASREECLRAVSMLAESTADTNYILGAFFDDAVRGIGSGNMPYDLLLDTEQAARLRDEYLAVLSGQQYNLFMEGYRIKPHEMLHRIPRSLN